MGLFVIAGLGNPGNRYENTRHNVGFDVIDLLSAQYGIKVAALKHKGLIGEGMIQGEKAVLVKPQTFMNLSGECISDVVKWYKADCSNLILIYDDADIPLGKIRIRARGSAGTHNGMKSVIYHLKTDNFPRVRIGIGKPPKNWDIADFVLSRFGEEERKLIDSSILAAAEGIETIIKAGVTAAMSRK